MPVEEQAAIIYLGTKGKLRNVPLDKVREFEGTFLTFMREKHKATLEALRTGKLTKEITTVLESVGDEIGLQYK